MAFSLLKDIGSIPSPSSKGIVASDVCKNKYFLSYDKKGRKKKKEIQKIEKVGKKVVTFKKANTTKNHYRQTVFNGLLALSWPSLHP
jgi:hypothetical protein